MSGMETIPNAVKATDSPIQPRHQANYFREDILSPDKQIILSSDTVNKYKVTAVYLQKKLWRDRDISL